MAEISRETQEVLETENFIDTYQIVAEWIRFADAKAAAVLTVAGALIGLLVPTLAPYLDDEAARHPTSWWPGLVIGLFLCWLVTSMLSGIWAFRCILPYTRKGRHPALDRCTHFHPAAISHRYKLDDVENFVNDCEGLDMTGLKHEVLAGLLIDSHISGAKYARVSVSIRLLALSAIFGFLYMLALQF